MGLGGTQFSLGTEVTTQIKRMQVTAMKRTSLLLIITLLIFCLAACAQKGAAPTSSADTKPPNTTGAATPQDTITTPQATTTTTPQITGTAPPQVTTATPQPAEETPKPSTGGVVLPAGALPDGGYTPYKPPERYYPETKLGLIPAPDYGRIWPYIGGLTSEMWMTGNLIGVCDDAGRIISDPYYSSAEMITHGEHQLYALIRNLNKKTRIYTSQSDYTEVQADIYETTLCPLDGSKAEVYDAVIYREYHADEIATTDKFPNHIMWIYWRSAVSYDYITAERDGKWGVLDWDGTVLLPFVYLEPVCFHEGLACILSDDGESVCFIDIKGRVVLGPYDAPPAQPRMPWEYFSASTPVTKNILFNEGFVRFYANGKYGMIDTSGNIIIPAIYEYIASFSGGVTMAVSVDDSGSDDPLYSIINSSGVVIAEGLKSIPGLRNGKVIIDYNWNTYRGVAITPDGAREPYDDAATNWTIIHDNIVEYADGHTLTIPGAARVDHLDDGRFIAYFLGRDGNSGTWRLCDENGSFLTEEQPGLSLRRHQKNDDGSGYLWMTVDFYGAYYALLLYDMDGNPVLRNVYSQIIPIGDRFMVVAGDWAGLVDTDENYIIKVSLKSYLKD